MDNKENRVSKIPFHLPFVDDSDYGAITDILKKGWLTTGQEALLFEKEFSEVVGLDYSLAVSSGTAGLHMGLSALAIGEGDEVIIPVNTFSACPEAVESIGARPRFCDSDQYGNIDLDELVNLLAEDKNKKIKAVMAVCFAGYFEKTEKLQEMAQKFDFKIIVDAAHSNPAIKEKKIFESFGDIVVFSFYASKPITTGEGGMVCFNKKKYLEKLRPQRLHGIRKSETRPWDYDIIDTGFKYNLPDLLAVLGRNQLRHHERNLSRRQEIACMYRNLLSKNEKINFLHTGEEKFHSWHLFIILVDKRDELYSYLQSVGIQTSVHFKPLSQMTYWKEKYALDENNFPRANEYFSKALSLPIYPDISGKIVKRISNEIIRFFE